MNGTIKSIRMLKEDIYEIVISLPSPVLFIPGQYVMLSYTEDAGKKHAFSIVAGNKNMITLVVKTHGDFTKKLCVLKPKDSIFVKGPYGRFIMTAEDKKYVFVAGGIGITPLYTMIMAAKRAGDIDIRLFYSVRENQKLFEEDFKRITSPKIQISYQITDVDGRLSPDKIVSNISDIKERKIYICGPPEMIESFRAAFLSAGILDENIRSEDFT